MKKANRLYLTALTQSEILAKQITKHLQIPNFRISIKKNFHDVESLIRESKADVLLVDLDITGSDPLDWIITLRKLGVKVPIALIGKPEQTKGPSLKQMKGLQVQDYFERSEIWRHSQQVIDRCGSLDSERRKKRGTKAGAGVEIILIGASTGAPEILPTILRKLPTNCPPVILIQHIDYALAEKFYKEMAKVSGLIMGKQVPRQRLLSGHLYMSTGKYHLEILRGKEGFEVGLNHGISKHQHIPSIDFLFNSCSTITNSVCAILLTGLGSDGARGLLALKKAGAQTLVQNKESCAVFGMPEAAITIGAAGFVGTPEEIRHKLDLLIS